MTRARRNVVSAVVTTIALAIIGATQLWPSWSRYAGTVDPAHVVAAGASADVDGRVWRLGAITHPAPTVGMYGRRLPPGTVRLVVRVERSGAGDPGSCTGAVTDGQRRWNAQRLNGYAVPVTDDIAESCVRPGALQWTFLLPDDVLPTAVDVVGSDGRIVVRLLL